MAYEFERRIAAANTLKDLAKVGEDIAVTRKALEKAGLITKPVPADKAVMDAVKDAFTDQLGTLEKIIVDGVWEGATADDGEKVPEGVVAAVKSALWESLEEILKEKFGKFAKSATEAVRSGSIKDIMTAGAEAAAALAKSIKDPDGLWREVIKKTRTILRNKGMTELNSKWEYALRKGLEKKLAKLGTCLSAIAKLLEAPVYIFFKILLTPTNIASDAEEGYLDFDSLKERLHARFVQLSPALPSDSTGGPSSSGPVLKNRIP